MWKNYRGVYILTSFEFSLVRRLQIHLRSLEVESDELQRRRHETPQQVEAISALERRMDLYELLSGMKIASHKTNGTREIYSILQAGRNGRK